MNQKPRKTKKQTKLTFADKVIAVGRELKKAEKMNINQVRGALIRDLYESSNTNEIVSKEKVGGYCSLGWLGCNKNLFKGMSFEYANGMLSADILRAYGFTKAEMHRNIPFPKELTAKGEFLEGMGPEPVATVIITLNDDARWSFGKIGDYLVKVSQKLKRQQKREKAKREE